MRPFQSRQQYINATGTTVTINPATMNPNNANARIRILAAFFVITSGTTATITISDGTFTLGPIAPGNGIPLQLPYNPDGWFLGAPGATVSISFGGTTPIVSGEVNYIVE